MSGEQIRRPESDPRTTPSVEVAAVAPSPATVPRGAAVAPVTPPATPVTPPTTPSSAPATPVTPPTTPSSAPATPARAAVETPAPGDAETRDAVNTLLNSLPEGMRETARQLFNDISAALTELANCFAELAGGGAVTAAAVSGAAGEVAATRPARISSRPTSFEVINESVIPQLVLRDVGLNIFTSGMPGANNDGNESTFNINQARVGLTALKQNNNLKTVLTLNGARNNAEYTALLNELGIQQIAYTSDFPHSTYLPGVTDRAQMPNAQEEWSNPTFKDFIKRSFRAYKNGDVLTQCENGAHRCLALNGILHAINNPTQTYEQITAATCTTGEAANGDFKAYAGLIQYIAGNETLINQIKSSVA